MVVTELFMKLWSPVFCIAHCAAIWIWCNPGSEQMHGSGSIAQWGGGVECQSQGLGPPARQPASPGIWTDNAGWSTRQVRRVTSISIFGHSHIRHYPLLTMSDNNSGIEDTLAVSSPRVTLADI